MGSRSYWPAPHAPTIKRSVPSLARSGMTTSTFNASAVPALREEASEITTAKGIAHEKTKRRHTFASRLAFLTICAAIILTALAYGTVHYWALAAFAMSAAALVCFWCIDGLTLRSI